MSELKKKLDGARPHCLPRALVLINPGNPTGTLNVYLFVITCNNINEDDDDDDDDDDEDGNDNKMSLFTLDIVLAHRLLRFSFLSTGCPLQKGFRYTKVLAI